MMLVCWGKVPVAPHLLSTLLVLSEELLRFVVLDEPAQKDGDLSNRLVEHCQHLVGRQVELLHHFVYRFVLESLQAYYLFIYTYMYKCVRNGIRKEGGVAAAAGQCEN